MPNNYFEINLMEALIATAGNLINVLPAPLKALTAEVVSRIKLIRLRAAAVWLTNLYVFSVLSNRAISSCNGGFGSTTWCTWHSTGLSPGSVPSLAFFLSISSSFFSARSMCLCFVGCGLCDSAWQMANLPDRSKCIRVEISATD